MSLLDEFQKTFVLMNAVRVSDGEGGFTTTWTDGPEVKISVQNDQSIQAQQAEASGVTSTYTFLFDKTVDLKFPDILRDTTDGQYYRITSKASDKFTPGSSSLNLSAVTAEKWVMTT